MLPVSAAIAQASVVQLQTLETVRSRIYLIVAPDFTYCRLYYSFSLELVCKVYKNDFRGDFLNLLKGL